MMITADTSCLSFFDLLLVNALGFPVLVQSKNRIKMKTLACEKPPSIDAVTSNLRSAGEMRKASLTGRGMKT